MVQAVVSSLAFQPPSPEYVKDMLFPSGNSAGPKSQNLNVETRMNSEPTFVDAFISRTTTQRQECSSFRLHVVRGPRPMTPARIARAPTFSSVTASPVPTTESTDDFVDDFGYVFPTYTRSPRPRTSSSASSVKGKRLMPRGRSVRISTSSVRTTSSTALSTTDCPCAKHCGYIYPNIAHDPIPSSSSTSASSSSVPLLPPYAPSPLRPPSSTDAKAVLTLDGGGVRGIFAPLFLLALQDHLPRGVDVRSLLDLVGGTSTGGVAALMYVRLGLPLERVVDIYMKMPKLLFGGRKLKGLWWLFTNSQHSTKKQRRIYARTVKAALGNAEAPLKAEDGSTDQSQCPVFVVTIDTADILKPTVFTSYSPSFVDPSKSSDSFPSFDQKDDVSIVTAALATSAAPTYFHPTEHAGRAYIDGGVGYNNPAELALKQLTQLYGPSAYAHTFISLGTGRRNENPYRPGVPRSRSGITGMLDILRTFAHISTDAEGVHARLEERFAQTCAYFRFNPEGLEDIVLDDWMAVNRAVEASITYLKLSATQKRLAELAARLLQARKIKTNND
ncbi:acyl transferase/acyl hydrolase/lysophospholipase [Phellopilus nigrolimitatus]|nr:acyl transferase/acyl hydrolase/lysophospholipase [Phellopilus nigrolimitatus]